jgi:hypothetical protein
VTHGEDSPMNAVQPTSFDPARDALSPDPGALQLRSRDHAVLSGRYPSDLPVPGALGKLLTHVSE